MPKKKRTQLSSGLTKGSEVKVLRNTGGLHKGKLIKKTSDGVTIRQYYKRREAEVYIPQSDIKGVWTIAKKKRTPRMKSLRRMIKRVNKSVRKR